MSIFEKLLRAGEGRELKRLNKKVVHVNNLEDVYAEYTDAELREETDDFKREIEEAREGIDDPDKQREAEDRKLEELLPAAFATVREAAKRVRGMRHYDVQLMGGMALHDGFIPEMKTGEGKTLVATLPSYLNALTGRGVHVITVNDYLAQRDAEWMGEIHRFLGMTVGVVVGGQSSVKRREAYRCDITYGTNNEFGFDYLRDNMVRKKADRRQIGHNFAIVDEVDSILIDEARTPLIISGPVDDDQKWYGEFSRYAERMQRDKHYEVDEKKNNIAVTEAGVEFVEDRLGVDNLYANANSHLVSYLNNAISAKELYKNDREYIVTEDGDVNIVDQFTGRILAGRRFNGGLHQAIEAKERASNNKVAIKQENQTMASITLQNYFRLYRKLAGMTGTAMTEAGEFNKVYSVGVVEIPTNLPMIRADETDVVYKTEEAKFQAVVEDIVERHEMGQPVLVGTVSVDKSELLSNMLRKQGVKHSVLNAKFHAQEAEIVALAGRKGAVTVATNMAGRGTDIKLGGDPEHMAAAELRRRGVDEADEDKYAEEWETALKKWTEECEAEGEEVREAGGLYVLGTERHESRRIDNQLRGRSGRQGDPGESRFYLSLRDDLMRKFNSAAVEALMVRMNMPDDMPIENKMVTRMIRSAQGQLEGQNAEQRKNILQYDEVMNDQRKVVYAERDDVLEGADVSDQVSHMMDDVVVSYVKGATDEGYTEDWDLDKLWGAFKQLYPIGITVKEVEKAAGGREGLDAETIVESVQEDIHKVYEAREEEIGAERMRDVEREVLLAVVDDKWRRHLYEMDYLKDGIRLRGYAQRDPVVEYKREGFEMFSIMMDGIKEDTVRSLFNLDFNRVEAEEEAAKQASKKKGRKPSPSSSSMTTVTARRRAPQIDPDKLEYSAPTLDGETGGVQVSRGGGVPEALRGGTRKTGPSSKTATGGKQPSPGQRVGSNPSRNAECPCGSGKKYKRCHGAPGGGSLD
ncbi:MAG: preprotein translocase subunit SecA [Stackebrandtia sp.]